MKGVPDFYFIGLLMTSRSFEALINRQFFMGAAKPISIKARNSKKEGGRGVVTIEKRNDYNPPTILSS